MLVRLDKKGSFPVSSLFQNVSILIIDQEAILSDS